MTAPAPGGETLLTPQEVAAMFKVGTKAVALWAEAGKLTVTWTLGGQRRYREAEVRALLPDGVILAAAVLGVPVEEVARLVRAGKLAAACRTPGGKPRYLEAEVRALLEGKPR